tara:strand:- start:756 stop:968 length:213 start_codon:yes stop_codon:yes gene_type:complete
LRKEEGTETLPFRSTLFSNVDRKTDTAAPSKIFHLFGTTHGNNSTSQRENMEFNGQYMDFYGSAMGFYPN